MLFGIDLGTTNSAISVYIGNEVSKIIELDNKETTMPSCVMLKNGEYIVGKEAYICKHLPNVVYSAKRYMGTDKVFTLVDGDNKVYLKPEEVGCEVIKGLVKKAAYLYPDIKNVTITVPAEFNDLQRKATERAGTLAGLNVVAIINEPTSASLAYETPVNKNIIVYDLGGGTFDVSVISVSVGSTEPEEATSSGLNFSGLGIDLNHTTPDIATSSSRPSYRILANEGDVNLGGDDLDKSLCDFILSNLNRTIRMDNKYVKLHKTLPVNVLEKLKSDVESVKKSLCAIGEGSAVFKINTGSEDLGILEAELSIEDFAKATMPLYRRTEFLVNSAVVKSKLNWRDISEIVLVGGSTKSSIIQQLLSISYPDISLNISINPDECVAIGASKQTAISMGESDTNITDVVPQTISVETICEEIDGSLSPGKLECIVSKNTPLPVSVISSYKLNKEGQSTIVKFYQGSGQYIHEAVKLGDLIVEADGSKDTVVSVSATINTNGVLSVKVKQGDVFVEKELSNVFGLSQDLPKKAVTPRDKIYQKLSTGLRSVYDRVPKKYIDALEDFRETGNKKSRELVTDVITKRKNKVSDLDIMENTSIFKESNNIESNENFEIN